MFLRSPLGLAPSPKRRPSLRSGQAFSARTTTRPPIDLSSRSDNSSRRSYPCPKGPARLLRPPLREAAFAEPVVKRTDNISTTRSNLSSRSEDASRRLNRALKGWLGQFTRPEGRSPFCSALQGVCLVFFAIPSRLPNS